MGPGGPSFLKGPDSAQLLPRHIGPREAGASLHLEGDKHHHPLPVEALMAAGAPRGAKKGMPFVGSLIFLEKKKIPPPSLMESSLCLPLRKPMGFLLGDSDAVGRLTFYFLQQRKRFADVSIISNKLLSTPLALMVTLS